MQRSPLEKGQVDVPSNTTRQLKRLSIGVPQGALVHVFRFFVMSRECDDWWPLGRPRNPFHVMSRILN